MALSTFDTMNMSKKDQDKIIYATDMWEQATDKADKDSWHQYAESIRSSYGYSGDNVNNFNNGGGYTQTGFAIPRLGDYADTTDYDERINEAFSNFNDREAFSYDQNTDPLYQSFLGKVNRLAETSFNDTIAGTSVGTGGRPNSWASTVASQTMGNMLMQGAEAMPTFRDSAYQLYKEEGNLSLEKLNALIGLDATAYGRYIDQYNAERDVYNSAVENKRTAISDALSRTQLTGYVSNADSLILGVPVGTLSAEATQRAWDMEDYLKKTQIDAMYTKSSSSGDDEPDSAWSKSDVYNYLKDHFGLKDSKLNGKPADIGKMLYSYYQSGYISEAELQEYAVAYGGILPADVVDKESGLTPAQKEANNNTAEGGRNQALTDSGMAYFYQQYKAGKMTKAQVNTAIKGSGFIFDGKDFIEQ